MQKDGLFCSLREHQTSQLSTKISALDEEALAEPGQQGKNHGAHSLDKSLTIPSQFSTKSAMPPAQLEAWKRVKQVASDRSPKLPWKFFWITCRNHQKPVAFESFDIVKLHCEGRRLSDCKNLAIGTSTFLASQIAIDPLSWGILPGTSRHP
jgi:hypothetical protein